MVAADPCTCCGTGYSNCPACVADKTSIQITVFGFHRSAVLSPDAITPTPWFCTPWVDYQKLNRGFSIPRVAIGQYSQLFGTGFLLTDMVTGGLGAQRYYLDRITATLLCSSDHLSVGVGLRIRALNSANLGACQFGNFIPGSSVYQSYSLGGCAAHFSQLCNQGASCTATGDTAPYSEYDPCNPNCESIKVGFTASF